MVNRSGEADSQRAVWRRLQRRVNLYIAGFALAALVVAVVAGAIVAWLSRPLGLPFRGTWIGATVLFAVVPWIAQFVASRAGSGRRAGGD